MTPKYGWKFHFRVELLSNAFYELVRHNFMWQGAQRDEKYSIDKADGIFIGSNFKGQSRKMLKDIYLTPTQPLFKVTLLKSKTETLVLHALNWPITIPFPVSQYNFYYCEWSIQTMQANDFKPWSKLC